MEGKKRLSYLKLGVITLGGIFFLAGLLVCTPELVSVMNSGSERKLPIYCVDTDKKQIALSFDAAWGNEDTKQILEVLKKHDVKVTFFMTGGWVTQFPDDVVAIHEAGHDLGNHSENHKQMSTLSAEQCKEEVMMVHDKVKALTDVDMELFRPPYGDYNNTLVETVNQCGYHCIQWDVDSLDWKGYDAATIIQKVTQHKHLGNGSIILMHNGAEHTAEALDEMITILKGAGYEIVPISKLIMKENYTTNVEGRQIAK